MKDVKLDGWTNLITGLGTTQDKSMYTTFRGMNILSDDVLSNLWVGDGFGKRIVEVVADDMTRQWIRINNDADKLLENEIDRLKVESKINLTLKWKRLFGGALIVIGINDGGELDEPVNINSIKGIDYLKVFDRTEIQLTGSNYEEDPSSPNYGEVKYFDVYPYIGGSFRIHSDRCLVFKGIPVPNRLRNSNNFEYWGMSVLQPIWDNLKDLGVSIRSASKILQEFLIGKYKLRGLAKLMAEDNEEKVRTRINMIDLSKSMIQSVLMDSDGEDYTRDSANIGGLPDTLDRFMMYISGVSGIPVTRLFGRSPAGLNSTGDGDMMNYYDMVKSAQKNDIEPQLNKLLDYINYLTGNKVPNHSIEFNSLIQLTDAEEIENRKKQSEIDKTYIEWGVLTSEEVLQNRFMNGYSYETVVDNNNG